MSVLPCDLLVESGVKIGKVCEFGEKSVGDKSDCDDHVDELVVVGELGGLNCSASACGVCFRILLLMISRYQNSKANIVVNSDYFNVLDKI